MKNHFLLLVTVISLTLFMTNSLALGPISSTAEPQNVPIVIETKLDAELYYKKKYVKVHCGTNISDPELSDEEDNPRRCYAKNLDLECDRGDVQIQTIHKGFQAKFDRNPLLLLSDSAANEKYADSGDTDKGTVRDYEAVTEHGGEAVGILCVRLK